MPRYYFHLHNDIDAVDEEGVELSDWEEAEAHALHEARIMFCNSAMETGRVVLSHRIDVEDEHGKVLGSVRFGHAVQIES